MDRVTKVGRAAAWVLLPRTLDFADTIDPRATVKTSAASLATVDRRRYGYS